MVDTGELATVAISAACADESVHLMPVALYATLPSSDYAAITVAVMLLYVAVCINGAEVLFVLHSYINIC